MGSTNLRGLGVTAGILVLAVMAAGCGGGGGRPERPWLVDPALVGTWDLESRTGGAPPVPGETLVLNANGTYTYDDGSGGDAEATGTWGVRGGQIRFVRSTGTAWIDGIVDYDTPDVNTLNIDYVSGGAVQEVWKSRNRWQPAPALIGDWYLCTRTVGGALTVPDWTLVLSGDGTYTFDDGSGADPEATGSWGAYGTQIKFVRLTGDAWVSGIVDYSKPDASTLNIDYNNGDEVAEVWKDSPCWVVSAALTGSWDLDTRTVGTGVAVSPGWLLLLNGDGTYSFDDGSGGGPEATGTWGVCNNRIRFLRTAGAGWVNGPVDYTKPDAETVEMNYANVAEVWKTSQTWQMVTELLGIWDLTEVNGAPPVLGETLQIDGDGTWHWVREDTATDQGLWGATAALVRFMTNTGGFPLPGIDAYTVAAGPTTTLTITKGATQTVWTYRVPPPPPTQLNPQLQGNWKLKRLTRNGVPQTITNQQLMLNMQPPKFWWTDKTNDFKVTGLISGDADTLEFTILSGTGFPYPNSVEYALTNGATVLTFTYTDSGDAMVARWERTGSQ